MGRRWERYLGSGYLKKGRVGGGCKTGKSVHVYLMKEILSDIEKGGTR